GKLTPQSITTDRPSFSTTYMFFPISPTPPRGMTRSTGSPPPDVVTPPGCGAARGRGPRSSGRGQEALVLEDGAEDVALHRRRLDERQSHARRGDEPEDLERRLDEDRVRGDEEGGVEVTERLVDGLGLVVVPRGDRIADRLQPLAGEVRHDRDDALAAHLG